MAGSCLTMDAALRNVRDWTGKRLEELLPYATTNPARQIGLLHRKGSIELGKDLILLF
ncbi:amidohydrolase family protein [Paenibacillus darwinianus]|uniref:amidohydrolase family protein n=1 Tax=Paenibacillus darwinianus TaxID=1380763 RepID=UPI0037C778E6